MSLALELEAKSRHPTNTTLGRDYKAWAKQIMYREERGDTELLAVQVTFAKEALGLTPPQQGKQ